MKLSSEALISLKIQRVPSEFTGQQSCNRCGVCCLAGPCQLVAGDEVRLAQYLNKTVAEVMRDDLEIGYVQGVRVLSPQRAEGSAACKFYDDEVRACTIEKVKPIGGKLFECWTKEGLSMRPLEWKA